jgi:hypothetical protein
LSALLFFLPGTFPFRVFHRRRAINGGDGRAA